MLSFADYLKQLSIRDLIQRSEMNELHINALEILQQAINAHCTFITIGPDYLYWEKTGPDPEMRRMNTVFGLAPSFQLLLSRDAVLQQHLIAVEVKAEVLRYQVQY